MYKTPVRASKNGASPSCCCCCQCDFIAPAEANACSTQRELFSGCTFLVLTVGVSSRCDKGCRRREGKWRIAAGWTDALAGKSMAKCMKRYIVPLCVASRHARGQG
jgi:hypothetical protein